MVEFDKELKPCLAALQAGGTILYPTDTVWGIGCNALLPAAVERIFTIKQRPANKSLILLLAEAKDLIRYVASPHPDIIAIVEGFTVPTTVVYAGAVNLPENVINANGSIAIRVTAHPFCKALIKQLKAPLVSTSANLSGMPTPAIFKDIDPAIVNAVDYTTLYRREDTRISPPSRIVQIADNGTMEIIRA